MPPGRAREAISPVPTGSPAVAKTIGMVEVARLAANAIGVPDVAITSTLSWTNSAAISAERSARPSAQRYAIAILRPSPQPSSPSLCTKAAVRLALGGCRISAKNPIVGKFAECCAHAPSGQRCRAAEQRDELAALSFDHLVGESEQCGRIECPGPLRSRRLRVLELLPIWRMPRSVTRSQSLEIIPSSPILQAC